MATVTPASQSNTVKITIRIKRAILNLNLFQSTPPAEDILTLQKQRYSTYVFLLLFIISLVTLIVYVSTVSIIRQETVYNPSYSFYEQLFNRYPQTLRCPCKRIAIPQKEFVQLNHSYHPVCSSIYIEDEWILLLKNFQPTRFITIYFNYVAPSFFQMLSSFCMISKQLIDEELSIFADTVFITGDVISASVFIEQTKVSIDIFISNLETGFMRLIELVRLVIDIEAPVSGLFTNVEYTFTPFNSEISTVNINPRRYNQTNCTCSRGTKCLIPAEIEVYSFVNMSVWIKPVPGIFVGCYNLDAILYSSLELFFNQTEINDMLQSLSNSNDFDGIYPSFNRTVLNRFLINTTGYELAARLFVDLWTNKTSHEKYFQFCQPTQCQYSFVSTNRFITIIAFILGMIGGLYSILHLSIPWIIHIVFLFKDKLKKRNDISTVTENEVVYPLKTRIRHVYMKIKHSIIHINLFSSYSPEIHANDIRNQRISTIIFIISLSSCFLILSINNALQKITTTTIYEATYENYQLLFHRHAETISCQCSSISVEQGVFMDVKPIFHPICSSDFISDEFLQYLSAHSSMPVYIGYNQFRFLRSTCDMINSTINDSLTILKRRRFTSQDVISIDVFNETIHEMINKYIITIIREFTTSLSFIKYLTIGNKLMLTYGSNVALSTLNNILADQIFYNTHLYSQQCNCLLEACTTPIVFLHNSEIIDTLGFYIGCYPIDYITKSNLQCFYDDNCTAQYLTLYELPRTWNVSVLNSSTTSSSISTSINDLLENLFVENWTISISHTQYYNQCKPSSCSYSILTQNNIVTILTVTIGLLGGIQIILRFLVPKLVQLISRSFIDIETTDRTNRNSLSRLWNNCKTFVLTYNLFPTYPPTEDRNQIRTTRLFIIVFTITLTCITSFNLLVTVSTTVTVTNPVYDEYVHLYDKYHQNLQCPCTSIAVSYSNFTLVNYSFHQICSSVYIGSIWQYVIADALLNIPIDSMLNAGDFRVLGSAIFQFIGLYCELANETISNELIVFNSQQLISKNVIERNIFSEQIDASFNLFVQTAESAFRRLPTFLREITKSNVFVSLTKSNVNLVKMTDFDSNPIISQQYNVFLTNMETGNDLCFCGPPSTCTTQSVIFGLYLQTRFNVTGMTTGCLSSEATLASTFSRFFDQICIDQLRLILNESSAYFYELNTTALDASLPSRYSSDSKIEEILNHVMLENVNYTASYQKYYQNCRPSECFYTIQTRNNPAYVLTLVLGLIGGLSNTLRVIIPHIMNIANKLFNRFRHLHRRQIRPF